MKLTRTIAIGVIAASASLLLTELPANAKSLTEAEIPAEFPPASFKGKQYVDSRGCVYIRAGIDGLVNWVPRVSRDRKVLCGYQPTFAKAAPTPVAKPADVPVISPATTPKPAAAPTAAPEPKPEAPKKAAPAPRRVVTAPAAKPTPRPAPARTKPQRVATAPAKPAAIAPKPAPAKPAATAAATNGSTARAKMAPKPTQLTSCAGVTGVSRYYSGNGAGIRCGSQSEPYIAVVRREPVTVMRDGKKVTVQRRVVIRQPARVQTQAPATTASAPVRLVPRHVWEQQQASKVDAPIPEGYRPAWKDDRLNSKRAHQTAQGIRATDLEWTRTVPRKLYVRATGEVVTRLYPGLKYPYHSYDEMRAAGYTVPDTGVLRPASRKTAATIRRQNKTYATMSTKRVSPSPAPAPAAKKAVAGRYVQVGTFGVEANARNSALKLKRLGLPARLGTLTRGGKSYRIVLAGPFAPDQAKAALAKARRAGFSDAFLR